MEFDSIVMNKALELVNYYFEKKKESAFTDSVMVPLVLLRKRFKDNKDNKI